MVVTFDKIEDLEKEFAEQEIEIHCTRATCMSTLVLKKAQYQRMVKEEGGISCPKCHSKMI